MWQAAKRLLLGLSLIGLTSSLLLLSDWHSREAPAESAASTLGKKWRINLIVFVQVVDSEETEKGILAGLEEAGLVAGRDYEITIRNAQGDMPTLSSLVDAAVTEGADLLITLSTPALQAAIRRGQGKPIIFTYSAAPVEAGAGRSYEDHLPNVTGIAVPAAYEDYVEVFRQCLPTARACGTVFVPAEVNSVYHKERLTEVMQRAGIEVVAVAANSATDLPDAALALTSRRLDALCQIGGNLTAAGFTSIAQAASKAKLPIFGFLTTQAREGAAVVVARDYYDGGREGALLAARVMRGESPAQIPFAPIKRTRIVINTRAVRASGLNLPPAVLQRASEVIHQ